MTELLFLMSMSASVLILLCFLLFRLTENRLSARQQYTAMKFVLIFVLLPIGPCLSFFNVVLQEAAQTPSSEMMPVLPATSGIRLPDAVPGAAPTEAAALPQLSISSATGQAFTALWGLCAAAILIYKFLRFTKFKRCLRQAGLLEVSPDTQLIFRTCLQKLHIRRAVRIQFSSAVPTPFATGLLKPAIILPSRNFSNREQQYILLHELTHIKFGDLWIRWLSMFASAVHWWNPLVWLWNRKLVELSEASCDERIVSEWSTQERIDYGRVLLKTACYREMPEGLTASISSARLLQRRVTKMLHAKALTKKQKMFSVGIILALLLCGSAAAVSMRSPVVIQENPRPAGVSGHASVSSGLQNTPSNGAQLNDPILSATREGDTGKTNWTSGDSIAEVGQSQAREPDISTLTQPPGDGAEDEEAAEYADPRGQAGLPQTYQNALRGDPTLISARGGTLLPDDDPESYYSIDGTFYKLFVSKDHYMMREYDVGNWDSLDPSKQRAAAETLVNGDYPRNSTGESYGPSSLANYVGYNPDLTAALGTRGEAGYVRDADSAALPSLPAETCPHEFMVPLYDSEGTVIGEFVVGCGGHFSGGATVDAVKTALGENSAP